MNSSTWTITQAKANFRAMIDRAMTEGPQTITRRGRTVATVVGAKKREKIKRAGTRAEFFASSPLRQSGLELPRRRPTRKAVL